MHAYVRTTEGQDSGSYVNAYLRSTARPLRNGGTATLYTITRNWFWGKGTAVPGQITQNPLKVIGLSDSKLESEGKFCMWKYDEQLKIEMIEIESFMNLQMDAYHLNDYGFI